MTIDLHGYTESDAIPVVLTSLMTFASNDDSELEIITGQGIVLRDVTIDLIEDEGYQWSFDGDNKGSIIVKKYA